MSSKSIAVPLNPSARRGARLLAASVVDDTEMDDVPPAREPVRKPPPRPALAQPTHRYNVGERLRMVNGGYTVARAAAFCKIVALLPYEGHGSLLYRVRSETEAFERVVAEADLSRNS
jgi:hypothetical protein